MVEVDIQIAVDDTTAQRCGVPTADQLTGWISTGLEGSADDQVVTVRIVDEAEISQLNQQYRHKAGATNVLSFPAVLPDGIDETFLGDIVICAAVVAREASEQSKTLEAHWCHMVIHGLLHLLGYDHIEERQAEEMESRETALLQFLGFPDPYAEAMIFSSQG